MTAWKTPFRLFCLLITAWLALPSGSARADEVACPGGGSSYRCFRAESGVTGQVDSWIARINANIPAGQDPVEYRHYDNVNLAVNWLWCREANGHMTNDVRNFARPSPMSTTDYRQTYCPAGEVRRWVRAGHVYRVPVSAIPTPGERDLNLANELNARIQSGEASTREQVLEALTQLENNEQDLHGMRPDRSETAALVAAIRTSVERLPATAPAAEPVVREVIRPSGYITLRPTEKPAIPAWILAVSALGLLMIGFAAGKYANQRTVRFLRKDLEAANKLVKAKIEEISALTRKYASMPSTEELMSVKAQAGLWQGLESYYNLTHLEEKQVSPQGTEIFSFDLMKRVIDQSFKFVRAKDQSAKTALSTLGIEYGDDLKVIVPLMKEDLALKSERIQKLEIESLRRSKVEEWLNSVLRRIHMATEDFGASSGQFTMPALEDGDVIDGCIENMLDFFRGKYSLAIERNTQLRSTMHRLSDALTITQARPTPAMNRAFNQDLARAKSEVEGLTRQLNDVVASSHEKEAGYAEKIRLLQQHLEEKEDAVRMIKAFQVIANGRFSETHSELERTLVSQHVAERFIKELGDGELFTLYSELEVAKVHFPNDPFFTKLFNDVEELLTKVMGFSSNQPANGAQPQGSVVMHIPLATGTNR